jgi:hypothetical protein
MLSQQLTGARAMDPSVVADILKRKALTSRKGAVMDQSKGMMWNAGGNALASAGDLATKFLGGLGVDKIMNSGGAQPTTLAPPAASPISFGGKTYDFTKKEGPF